MPVHRLPATTPFSLFFLVDSAFLISLFCLAGIYNSTPVITQVPCEKDDRI